MNNQSGFNFDRLSNYQLIRGASDEMMTSSGEVKPIWRPFIEHLDALQDSDLQRRCLRANQYLADAGVFFRQYGDDSTIERDWPLSHIPVLVSEREWKKISNGLIQRAEVLDALVQDIYGENTLVANGVLPPQLVAENPEWLRPLVGVKPRDGHYLNFLAFEISRGPNGNWWILGDRTQAPSGAGFALENRVATSRAFSDFFFDIGNIHRLAGFFKEFRDALNGLSQRKKEVLGILTPGRLTDTYYEHAYIARYLGLTLLEGEDLIVIDNEVMVRTVQGLRPVSVLWRRLDSEFSDPLELNENSQLGTAGLVNAVRSGNVSLVNAIGSGVLETRALMAFMPKIAKALKGESLQMPNIATWWCGQSAERKHVLENLSSMIIGETMSTSLSVGKEAGKRDLAEITELLKRDNDQLVGQEVVTLSTTPVLENNKLTPKPMTIRVFACRTQSGWTVMPGGYARIGRKEDPSTIALQQGGAVADVWVVSESNVTSPSLILERDKDLQKKQLGTLPSRAADNLFWLGRYAERSENVMRMLRAYHLRFADNPNPNNPLLRHLENQLFTAGVNVHIDPIGPIAEILELAFISATKLRDRLSDDGWLALKHLVEQAKKLRQNMPLLGDEFAREMNELIHRVTALSGLIHENMYRFIGWRFLNIGRSLERAIHTSTILLSCSKEKTPQGAWDLVLEVCDSAMSYRRLYNINTQESFILELVAFDELNPRSIAYHLIEIKEQISFLPLPHKTKEFNSLKRSFSKMSTDFSKRSDQQIPVEKLKILSVEMASVSNRLSSIYFS